MRTSFVFDYESRLLGVLEHSNSPEWGRFFNADASPPRHPMRFSDGGCTVGETARYVRFAWGCMQSSRGIGNDHRADILLVAAPDIDHLGNLNGFRWFAEAYGVPAIKVQAPV